MSLQHREGSPFWQYDFTVNGQRFRGSTGEKGKRQAAKVEDELRQSARLVGKQSGGWTIHRLFQAYWDEHAKDRPSSATILGQLATMRAHFGKDRRVMALTNALLIDYRTRRIADGLAPHSVNREIEILRAACRHAHILHDAPLPKLNWAKLKSTEPPPRQRYLTFTEWGELLAVAHASIKPVLICAVTTGLRKANILTMDWSQVRLEANRITMTVKGGNIHEVRVTPYLAAALSVMPTRKGKVFDTRNFEKRWRAATKGAGLENFRFHDLRHTFASWARQNGADIADVKEALGHSNISMTMRYAHIKPDDQNTAFDKVSAALASHSAPQSLRERQN
jgi:integrase